MAMFMVLILPLPFSARRKLFHFLATNHVVGQIQYGIKITFIFVAVLFVDAVQRMLKTMNEVQQAKLNKGAQDVRTETSLAAKRFYTQRNMYLTGFTLFLSLILSRTHSLVVDLIKAQEENVAFKKGGAKVTQSEKQAYEQQIETLKKQAKGQHTEYLRLSDELNALKGETSSKKD
ncbi:Endoplasmic reticulum transmembrane protein 3 [Tilletia horrida]|uniref:Endoplasmic reticulum transmembrane protein n=1 Tax=Tilletia horrida TaxID=155126 RepID=A0AAN6GUG3_9BASI|nr:Endoplasmic reticulum transmembrane protein 3 [Tilletia horrida]